LAGASERIVWVADSFQGFPASNDVVPEGDEPTLSMDLAAADFLAVPLDEARANFERFGLGDGVSFVPGFFQDTLPSLAGRRWAIVRLDGDTYDATMVGLRSLYPGLQAGGYVIVDDYLSLDECRAAVEDFRREHGIDEPIEEVDWNSVRWRRVDAGDVVQAPGPQAAPPPRSVARSTRERIPAIEELQLGEELQRVRKQLAAVEKELAYLTGSPLRGPKRWLGRQLRR
jgi:hypothetical protein